MHEVIVKKLSRYVGNKISSLQGHISGPRLAAFQSDGVKLHTLNTNEVVVSHAFISVRIPEDSVLVSSSVHHSQLRCKKEKIG
ncbi:hypothetical protein ACHAXM_009078 [Skeletonema potamos]